MNKATKTPLLCQLKSIHSFDEIENQQKVKQRGEFVHISKLKQTSPKSAPAFDFAAAVFLIGNSAIDQFCKFECVCT